MPTYECTVAVSAIAAGAPYCALRAPTRTARLKEIRAVATSAAASTIGLSVPANVSSVVPTGASITPIARDPRDIACTALIDTAWTTAPTGPANGVYKRSEPIAGTIGNGLPWVFPDPEVVPLGTQLALFNSGPQASGQLNITFVFEE